MRVEELARQPEVALDPIHGVATHGQLDRLEMDADLMGPPRLERDFQKRPLTQSPRHLEPGDRVARRLRVQRAPEPVGSVASDRRVDPARP